MASRESTTADARTPQGAPSRARNLTIAEQKLFAEAHRRSVRVVPVVGVAEADRWVPQWQPIETAPKDALRILTYGTLHANGENEGERAREQLTWWDKFTGTWVSSEWGSHAPTHWMPLPEPPK